MWVCISVKDVSLTSVWVSMKSKEQFIGKAKQMLLLQQQQQQQKKEEKVISEKDVVQLVEEAAQDISFYMQKAALFDHTILNDM